MTRPGRKAISESLALLVASCATGATYAASFPDPGWSLLAWIALVPLFAAIRGCKAWAATLLTVIAAVVGTYVGCYWVWFTFVEELSISAGVATLLLFVIGFVLAVPYGCVALALRWSLGVPGDLMAIAASASLWVLMEWTRINIWPGFAWMPMGVTQASTPELLHIARVTGIYGVSFFIVWTNFALIRAVAAFREPGRDWRRVARLLLYAMAGPALLFALGLMTDAPPTSGETLTVAMVQPSIPPRQHWDPALLEDNVSVLLALSHEVLRQPADILVWPEAAALFNLRSDRRFLPQLMPSLMPHGTSLLTGTPIVETDGAGRRLYNSVVQIDAYGHWRGRYDKRLLLPFGEFRPQALAALDLIWGRLRRELPNADIAVGVARPALRVGDWQLATLVCHEATFPSYVRQRVEQGAGFIVNLSNDAWFATSAGAAQHLAHAIPRAVETGRPMVRSANNGISVIVNPNGRVVERLGVGRVGTLRGQISPREGHTLYTRWGDWFVILCLLFSAFAVAVASPALRHGARLWTIIRRA